MVNFAVSGQDLTTLHVKGVAVEIGHLAARFGDQQHTGSIVPRLITGNAETFIAATGNITEGECRRTFTADGLTVTGKENEVVQAAAEGDGITVIGKAYAEKTFIQGADGGNVYFIAVKDRAFTGNGGEHFVGDRVIDNADDNLVLVHQGDGCREVGILVQIVYCAVQRVDDPAIVGRFSFFTGLFRQDGVSRKSFADDVENDAL